MSNVEGVMAVIRATRPNFRNAHDKLALAVHSMFLNSGYFLTATGSKAFCVTTLTSPPSDDEVGIEGWNQTEASYGFVYSKSSSKDGVKFRVLVKCLVMGDFLVVNSMSSKYPNKEPLSLQINVNDYNQGGDGERATNFANHFKNFDELVKKLHTEILSKLEDTPYETTESSSSSSSCSSSSSSSTPSFAQYLDDAWIRGRNNAISSRSSTPHPDVGILSNSDYILYNRRSR
ncbi:hypothetical protein MKW98_012759 [Papaver atlanticum]|uniref:PI31 proteasome regulator N-terminal domain-containing protein n=1 Tax=Papaver atlanticum TaxID=357466 RepID=A0AAD4T3W8_9MAGN|nr:hypothetical protein MKW98_012759 [Papaver atlanticum]